MMMTTTTTTTTTVINNNDDDYKGKTTVYGMTMRRRILLLLDRMSLTCRTKYLQHIRRHIVQIKQGVIWGQDVVIFQEKDWRPSLVIIWKIAWCNTGATLPGTEATYFLPLKIFFMWVIRVERIQ